MSNNRLRHLSFPLLALLGSAASAEAPLSAIDWLSDSITAPVVLPTSEPPVSTGAIPGNITTTALDGPKPDATGLLPPSVTGLPFRLWGGGDPATIARQIRAAPADNLPAGQSLLSMLLLAEAEPPSGGVADGALLTARIDKLLDLGLVEEAGALIERAGATSPELFRRAFDVALLLGDENRACAAMRARPDVAPTYPARIFCLARGGDWNAAALTLGTAHALGQITPEEDDLLSRFLDPDIHAAEGLLPPPARPSPLMFRLYEAVGEALPTTLLPRAFAHADLRDVVGWKGQIEAAERLARAGALDPNRLLGLYTERRPAASGGVWDRAAGMQALDDAISGNNRAGIERALPRAWGRMLPAGLGPVLARLYGERLEGQPLSGQAAAIAFRLALLSPRYEAAAASRRPADREEVLLAAIARGIALPRAEGSDARALAGLGHGALPPARAAALIREGRLGEVILGALEDMAAGRAGDPQRMGDALATLRAVGLEGPARRAALEYLILADPA